MSTPLKEKLSILTYTMSIVNILCGHHHYPELPLLTWAWSLPELHGLSLECSSTPTWRRRGAGRYLRLCTPPPTAWGSPKDVLLGSSQETCFTLFSLFSKAMVVLEVCLESLSCWNTALLPSFWREGIMLCCSISQYMLEFMFPSIKYNSPTPAALMQP